MVSASGASSTKCFTGTDRKTTRAIQALTVHLRGEGRVVLFHARPSQLIQYSLNMKQKQIDGLVFSTWVLLFASLIIFVASGAFWYRNIYLNESQIFWSAIENALSTNGVERTQDYSTDATVQTQVTHYSFTPRIASEVTSTHIVQGGQDVVSRAISFPDDEYAVFENVSNAENPQLEKAEGIWTQTGTGDRINGALADSLTNGALVFVGNLPKPKREQLVSIMQGSNMYEIITSSGTREYNGKTAKVYELRLNPEAYNAVLVNYFQMIGMPQYAEQVASTTKDLTTPKIEIAIDPVTRTIYEAGYPKLGESGSHRYSLWGVARSVAVPESAITSDELQKILAD